MKSAELIEICVSAMEDAKDALEKAIAWNDYGSADLPKRELQSALESLQDAIALARNDRKPHDLE